MCAVAFSLYISCFIIVLYLLEMYDLCFYKAIQRIYQILTEGVYLFPRTVVIKYQKLSGLK